MMDCEAALKYIQQRSTPNDKGCWIWNLSLTDDGYGRASWQNKNPFAHRLSYQAANGGTDLPKTNADGKEIVVRHKCVKTPSCVNPDVMSAGYFK